MSRLRTNSSTFRDLPIAQKSVSCGIVVLHLPTGSLVAQLQYQSSVEEIYDVKILPGLRRANVLSHQQEAHRMALTLPHTGYWMAATASQQEDQPEEEP